MLSALIYIYYSLTIKCEWIDFYLFRSICSSGRDSHRMYKSPCIEDTPFYTRWLYGPGIEKKIKINKTAYTRETPSGVNRTKQKQPHNHHKPSSNRIARPITCILAEPNGATTQLSASEIVCLTYISDTHIICEMMVNNMKNYIKTIICCVLWGKIE